MIYRDWHAGMKIVCVDNSGQEPNLTVGRIYTIAVVTKGFLGKIYVGLVESDPDAYWWPHRFRPLKKHETDISVFTSMLNKDKVPA
jgi:hypothetical protein